MTDEKLARVLDDFRLNSIPRSDTPGTMACRPLTQCITRGFDSNGNVARPHFLCGRALFEKNCASCHVMHEKRGRIEPGLTGSDWKNLSYLLENMIDPSSVVAGSFQTSVILLEDGRLTTGAVSEQNDRTLKPQIEEELLTLDRNEIEETKHTKLSLMPDGLLDPMTPEQKRDLLGFLMH